MGCRSSQKKFQRYRPKIDVWGKIFVFALFTKSAKVAVFGPKKWHFEWPNQNSKTTFIVQTFFPCKKCKTENLSLNVNFWSITLNFFCELLQPKSLSS